MCTTCGPDPRERTDNCFAALQVCAGSLREGTVSAWDTNASIYSSFDGVFLRQDYEESEESDNSGNETKELGGGEKNMQANSGQSSADQGTTSSVTKAQ